MSHIQQRIEPQYLEITKWSVSPKGNNLFAMCTSEPESNNLAKNQKQNQKKKQRTIEGKVLLLFGIHSWDQKKSAFA